ncbi:MAG: aspartate aminotransferase family protein [Chromatiales bacterium]|nr:aspartate aminotransferase family protein [Chromatiales bacterium]
MTTAIMPTYARLPVQFSHGEGVWLWDESGKRYLDALSGIAVCSLGHAHPAVSGAICEQAGKLVHTSNLYGIQRQEELARRLTALTGMQNVFFANSGAEANEAAIKLARFYGHSRGIDRPAVVVMESSFHGRTLATLSATGNAKIQAGFEPLVEGFVRVPYNDLDAIRQVAEQHANVVAVLVEPVQGEGGVNVPTAGYLNGIREICDRHQWLMMLDEIQTGIGRTGRFVACQHEAVVPDVLTLAKALGNGVPIGACLASGKAAGLYGPGNHGSTFGGNPLACAAALAVVKEVADGGLVERAAELGERMLNGFRDRLTGRSGVVDLRGKGLMIGIQLGRPCTELVKQALSQGLLINVTAGSTIRLLPPLILSDAEADQIVEGVSDLVLNFLEQAAETAA